ncbi:MAG TPA: hypothetical protein VG432_15210 [Gemmatimonadaceae bacterium]|nr:hypothetical protein [Gemmatimonadaceae bacterium]
MSPPFVIARIAALLLLAPAVCAAQNGSGASGAVALEVRPRAGDTVSVRLEQRVEMTGTRRIGGRDSTARVTSSMVMFARTIVESVTPAHSIVATHTDSVRLETSDDHAEAMRADAIRALAGTVSRLRILPDGTGQGVDSALGGRSGSLVAVMPATLPGTPVAVGGKWTRTMPIPSSNAARGAGEVRAVFRLDSLTSAGRYAWISMKGSMRRDERAPAGGTGESAGAVSGSITGAMTLDRRRGWIVSALTDMTVHSTVTTPNAPSVPLKVTVRVIQKMRAENQD